MIGDEETEDPTPNVVSSCCKAKLTPAHPSEDATTNYFVCSACEKPCGFEIPKSDTVH